MKKEIKITESQRELFTMMRNEIDNSKRIISQVINIEINKMADRILSDKIDKFAEELGIDFENKEKNWTFSVEEMVFKEDKNRGGA